MFRKLCVAVVVTACAWLGAVPPTEAASSTQNVHLANSWRAGPADISFTYGSDGDVPITGDWDGNGTDTVSIRRGNQYHIKNNFIGGQPNYVVNYGKSTDSIYVGDWDGNGTDTLAVRRGNAYHVKNTIASGNADATIRYGKATDETFVGDWDGDGIDTFAVRRGNTFYVKNTLGGGNADVVFNYGRKGDQMLIGDWDGDGKDTFAVRRDGTWHLRNDLQSGPAHQIVNYGKSTDLALVGDWDGNGTDTPGVYRPRTPLKAAGACAPLNDGRSRYTTGNANRVSLVVAESYGTSYATFTNCAKQWNGTYYEEWSTPTRIGARGIAQPGEPAAWHTMKTPTGSYTVTESFGVYNPGTALTYRQLNSRSKWGGTAGVNYNKYFEGPKASSADEDMWAFANSGDYRLGVVINYNRPPDSSIREGMGYAIFLHANKVGTAGCVSLHEHEVARYMKTAQKGDRIIMGVRSHLFG